MATSAPLGIMEEEAQRLLDLYYPSPEAQAQNRNYLAQIPAGIQRGVLGTVASVASLPAAIPGLRQVFDPVVEGIESMKVPSSGGYLEGGVEAATQSIATALPVYGALGKAGAMARVARMIPGATRATKTAAATAGVFGVSAYGEQRNRLEADNKAWADMGLELLSQTEITAIAVGAALAEAIPEFIGDKYLLGMFKPSTKAGAAAVRQSLIERFLPTGLAKLAQGAAKVAPALGMEAATEVVTAGTQSVLERGGMGAEHLQAVEQARLPVSPPPGEAMTQVIGPSLVAGGLMAGAVKLANRKPLDTNAGAMKVATQPPPPPPLPPPPPGTTTTTPPEVATNPLTGEGLALTTGTTARGAGPVINPLTGEMEIQMTGVAPGEAAAGTGVTPGVPRATPPTTPDWDARMAEMAALRGEIQGETAALGSPPARIEQAPSRLEALEASLPALLEGNDPHALRAAWNQARQLRNDLAPRGWTHEDMSDAQHDLLERTLTVMDTLGDVLVPQATTEAQAPPISAAGTTRVPPGPRQQTAAESMSDWEKEVRAGFEALATEVAAKPPTPLDQLPRIPARTPEEKAGTPTPTPQPTPGEAVTTAAAPTGSGSVLGLPRAAEVTAAETPESRATTETSTPGPTPMDAQVATFTTALGSTYTVDAQGRTQRTKSLHPGHPATDVGLKDTSERTVYVSDATVEGGGEIASLLGGFQTHPATHKGVVIRGNTITALYYDAQQQQWVQAFGPYPFTETPQTGLAPLEVWQGQADDATGATMYPVWHPGNQITEVGQVAPPQAAATATPPAITPTSPTGTGETPGLPRAETATTPPAPLTAAEVASRYPGAAAEVASLYPGDVVHAAEGDFEITDNREEKIWFRTPDGTTHSMPHYIFIRRYVGGQDPAITRGQGPDDAARTRYPALHPGDQVDAFYNDQFLHGTVVSGPHPAGYQPEVEVVWDRPHIDARGNARSRQWVARADLTQPPAAAAETPGPTQEVDAVTTPPAGVPGAMASPPEPETPVPPTDEGAGGMPAAAPKTSLAPPDAPPGVPGTQGTTPDAQGTLPAVDLSQAPPLGEGQADGTTTSPPGVESPGQPDTGALETVSPEDDAGTDAAGTAGTGSVRGGVPGARTRTGVGSTGPRARSGVGTGAAGSVPAGGDATSRPGLRSGTSRGSGKTGLDYTIADPAELLPSGPKDRFRRNVEAIRLLKQLEAEGRQATAAEQTILARYSGWGATSLQQVFQRYPRDEWATEAQQLRALLTDEEYAAARASTPNAHYTSGEVIQAIYGALERLGFRAGRLLEPAMGVGNFFGLMPAAMREASSRTGIELDPLSGRIATQLYQSADIRVQGFQDALLADNFFDVAISNVPFGDYTVHDPRYNKYHFNIHNYFFAKALDLVRPGGIVAFITSPFTLDSRSAVFREYLQDKALFLGAIRLPEGTFGKVAETQTSTDVIFLQKRGPEVTTQGQSFLDLARLGGTDINVNAYYAADPRQMLGTMERTSTMYGPAQPALQARTGLDLSAGMARAVDRLPEHVYQPAVAPITQQTRDPIALTEALPQQMFVLRDGVIHQVQGTQLVPQTGLPATTQARITGMVGVRDALLTLRRLELANAPDADLAQARQALNDLYDRYVAQYGALSGPGVSNLRAFRDDPYWQHLLALEVYNTDTQTATKAKIFTERISRPIARPTSAATPSEALLTSLAWNGRIDWVDMARLTGQNVQALQEALAQQAFENPNGGAWETAEHYLGGDVRTKLREAQAAALTDPRYQGNVQALEAVQPEAMPIERIATQTRLGASWIPDATYQEFFQELLDIPLEMRHNETMAIWELAPSGYGSSVANDETWGGGGLGGHQIATAVLNFRQPKIYTRADDGSRVFEKKATLAVHDKMRRIQEAFREWMVADGARAAQLETLFNDTQNKFVDRQSDGQHLELPGFSAAYTPRPYQKNSIWRAIRDGTLLFAHEVGAGKTLSLTATAMELRRLGLARKPLILVPNHLINQWPAEFLRFYPEAKILAATQRDLEKSRRQQFFGRITTDDWDAVIVPYSAFKFLPVSDQWFNQLLQQEIRQIDQVMAGLDPQRDRKGRSRDRTVKELEKAKQRLVAKLRGARKVEKQEQQLHFEELGVDALLVDEAHNFKNLYFPSKINRMAGLGDRRGADQAFDLYAKVRYIQQLMNGRNIFFATGTPLSNTIAEAYTMQRYLQPGLLKEQGLEHFDAWAATFADTVTRMEVSPTGAGFVSRTSFSQFRNARVLLAQMRQVFDIQTQRMLHLPRPDLAGDAPEVVTVPASPELKAYVQTLLARAKSLGSVDPRDDNMLKITNDGRKAALDLRTVLPRTPEPQHTKVKAAVERLVAFWHQSADYRGTQLVFLDLGIPRRDERGDAQAAAGDADPALAPEEVETADEATLRTSVYADIKRKLIAQGVPAQEIAFIHEANTDARRAKLFQDVRDGRVRILLGSTRKMAEGMNVQDRLFVEHQIDSPWKPNELTQREGRILRPGNRHKEWGKPVHIYRYVTEESFDAYMWQTVERKQRAFGSFLEGTFAGDSIEDLGDAALRSFSEATAAASGNPLVLEKVQLEAEIERMQAVRQQAQGALIRQRRRAEIELPSQMAQAEGAHALKAQQQQQVAAQMPGELGLTTADGATLEGNAAVGTHLLQIAQQLAAGEHRALAQSEGGMFLGTLPGLRFPLFGFNQGPWKDADDKTHQRVTHVSVRGRDGQSVIATLQVPLQLKDGTALAQSLRQAIETSVARDLAMYETWGKDYREEQAALRAEIAKPLPYTQELQAAQDRLLEVVQQTGMEQGTPADDVVVTDEPDEGDVDDAADTDTPRRPGRLQIIPQGQSPADAPQSPLAPTFFSKLLQYVRQKLPERLSVERLRSLIDPKRSGVKAEELKWLGVYQFLDEHTGQVTQQELLAFLEATQVQVEVRVLGEGEGPTRNTRWTEPGAIPGSDREILLTLPEGSPGAPAEAFTTDTTHYGDVPNVVGWLRVNDRVDAQGRKVLFVEEVQSKWRMEGTKAGFRDPEAQAQAEAAAMQAAKDLGRITSEEGYTQQREQRRAWMDINHDIDMTGVPSRLQDAIARYRDARVAANAAIAERFNSPPTAPFVTQGDWFQLPLKFALRYASEHGYAGVAWTTGTMQQERYSLRKQVGTLVYDPVGRILTALDRGGRRVLHEGVAREQLDRHIGKENAARLLATPPERTAFGVGPVHLLDNEDIAIGGEWAVNLYDNDLTGFLNKYGKQWGARVETTAIDTTPAFADTSPFEVVDGEGNVMARLETRDMAEAELARMRQLAPEEAHNWSVRTTQRSEGGTSVPYLPITPAMRRDVLTQGQPLFQRTGAVPAGFGPVSVDELRQTFETRLGKKLGVRVQALPSGVIRLHMPRQGTIVEVENVHYVSATEAEIRLGYGEVAEGAQVSGRTDTLAPGVIRVKIGPNRTETTVEHEITGHIFEEIGLLDARDIAQLNKDIARQGGVPGFPDGPEARAEFLAGKLNQARGALPEGVLGQIILKVQRFLDAIVKALGIRTTGQIVRRVQSGAIFRGEGRIPGGDSMGRLQVVPPEGQPAPATPPTEAPLASVIPEVTPRLLQSGRDTPTEWKRFLAYHSIATLFTPEHLALLQQAAGDGRPLYRKEYWSLDASHKQAAYWREHWLEDPDELVRWQKEVTAMTRAWDPFQAMALRGMAGDVFELGATLYERDLMTQEEFQAFADRFTATDNLLAARAQAASTFGLGLRLEQDKTRAELYSDLIRKINEAGATIPPEDLAALRQAADEAMKANDFYEFRNIERRINNPTLREMWKAQYIGSLLSNPATWMTNLLSTNAYMVLKQAAIAPMHGFMDFVFSSLTGRPREVFIQSGLPALGEFWRGGTRQLKQAWWLFWDDKAHTYGRSLPVWQKSGSLTGEATFTASELQREGALERAVYPSWVPGWGGQKAERLRTFAPWLTFASRIMDALDIGMRGLALDMNLAAAARNNSLQLGLEVPALPWQVSRLERDWIAAQHADPVTGKPTRVFEQALAEAQKDVFRDKASKFATTLSQLGTIKGWGVLFDTLFPFKMTPDRLMARGFELLPGNPWITVPLAKKLYQSYTGEWQGWLPKLDPTKLTAAEAQMFAKQMVGLIVVGILKMMWDEGLITGQTPDDPNEREGFYRQGKVPNAARFGDTWLSWRRFEPMALPLGIMTMVFEAWDRLEAKRAREETPSQGWLLDRAALGAVAAQAASEFILDSSYFAGIAAFFAGTQRGREAGDIPKGVMRQMATIITPWVSAQRMAIRAADAAGVTPGSIPGTTLIRQPTTLAETIASMSLANVLAGQGPPARRDIFGRPQTRETTPLEQLLPIARGTARESPLEAAYERLRMRPGHLDPHYRADRITGKRVRIPNDLYRRLEIRAGELALPRLEAEAARPDFNLFSPVQQRKRLENIRSDANRRARREILRERGSAAAAD